MSNPSSAPTIRIVSWTAALVNLAILLLFMTGAWLFAPEGTEILIGAGSFLVYSLGSRYVITRAHRKGIRLVRQGRYEEAIAPFEESYRFFTRHAWIDRFRAVILLSPSAMSYREMAMCNLAFCYSQIGQGAKSKEMYRSVLMEYPRNNLAWTALRMIESAEQTTMAASSSLPTTQSGTAPTHG